ncbi:hypothetical protein SAMN02745126_05788 [Enhydrobacter aerosaccus]|uniref:Uncharacterized protein n=1 Tax=Enhydrobacter aerosaccus TaxID=225324 RepID=A0A1T4T7B1_9HYPH|nr:hypothetical protein [Enhydrobacter aerosaccus]SKA36229.1 hypothetical protein SAMN02745126_05788 [Enhydrobacter aerosaccus]
MRLAIHGSPTWLGWAQAVLANARKKYSLDIEIVSLPDALTATSLVELKQFSRIVLLIENPALMVARRGMHCDFNSALLAAVTAAVSAYELTYHYDAVPIDVDGSEDDRTCRLLELADSPLDVADVKVPIEVVPLNGLSEGDTLNDRTRTIERCLKPLLEGIWQRNSSLSICWPRDVLFAGDSPGTPLPAVFDIAGPARVLTYGPYFPLPIGQWHVELLMGFSQRVGVMPFLVEIVADGIFHRAYFEAKRAGIFVLPFDLSFDRSGSPVEIRLVSQEPALEGEVSLIEATFTMRLLPTSNHS